MIAFVLAAGLGTRLRPRTLGTAKPALPLLGASLLEVNLRQARRAGVREVVVNAAHLPHTVIAVAREACERLELLLHLSIEAGAPRGTGGALVQARPLLDRGEPFLLLNGDTLVDVDVRALVAAHGSSGAVTTLAVRRFPEGAPYTPVEVDASGRLLRLGGKGVPGLAAASRLFVGVHVLSPAIFEVLPKEGAPCVNRDGHLALVARGDLVQTFLDEGRIFHDVGTPERYVEANLAALDGTLGPVLSEGVFGAAVARAEGVWVDPTAVIASGAQLRAPCFVGARAQVGASARLGPRGVVLAGASLSGELRDGAIGPG